jgi:hypothetical protein
MGICTYKQTIYFIDICFQDNYILKLDVLNFIIWLNKEWLIEIINLKITFTK